MHSIVNIGAILVATNTVNFIVTGIIVLVVDKVFRSMFTCIIMMLVGVSVNAVPTTTVMRVLNMFFLLILILIFPHKVFYFVYFHMFFSHISSLCQRLYPARPYF